MNREQLRVIYSIIEHAKRGAESAKQLERLIDGDPKADVGQFVQISEPLVRCRHEEEAEPDELGYRWHTLSGDASKADSDYFRVRWSPERPQSARGGIRIEIECPTFLRGRLTLHVHETNDGTAAVQGGY